MPDNNLSIFNSTLPTTATETITSYDTKTTTASLLPSYINVTITNGGQLNGIYDAWCVNSTVAIKQGIYDQAGVYSSYGSIPAGILYTGSQTVTSSAGQYLTKLQQINWLINNVVEASNLVNNQYRYNNVDYTWGDVQLAIWKLLGESSVVDSGDYSSLDNTYSQQRADALVSLAVTNGTNFIPVAGQDVGVIVKGANLQPILMEVKSAGIGDVVWHDLNANGIQEANEEGIDGATVTLLDSKGNVVANTITGDNPYTTQIEKGWYQFGPLLPSTYQIKFSLPTGFNTVSPYLQGNTSLDSNANINNNLTSTPITLVAGEVNKTIDAGFYKKASLGDKVFNDANNNGTQDATEAGVAGVTVQLINPANGSVIATTTTDANGAYNFSNLIPGNYQVKFTSPAGYIFSAANIGDDAKDSDANSATGLTQTITLTSGEFNGTLDAGLVQLASLGNFVFEDKNANGIQEAGEAGIANATVKLLDAAGNVIATTITDENGLYSFSNLTPGEYKVQFVQPDGFNGVSAANVGSNDAVDSDGLISDVVSLSPGENNTTVDSGFYKTASLGDFVFNDANNNGIQDATETGIAGVTVELINPVDGSVIGTTTTDANGAYTFSGIIPGNYQVKFTSPAGYIFSAANIGDDAKDSDANSATGLTQTITLTSGEFNGTLDAGLVQLASLGNFVFEDKNANGIQEAGEAGIANATVKLLDAAGNIIATTTTDENGLYSFSDLTPGEYKVQFVQPDGFNGVSAANVGSNNAIDSDGLISNVVSLSPGENNTTVDSGFYKTASLGDFVFNDANNNGTQDATETGIAGVTVQLINPVDSSVAGTTTTDANGAYTFSGIIPGNYQVKFTSPAGYIFSAANIGDDAKDSDANSATGLTQTITLRSGEYNSTLDAGLVKLASLGNFVFKDKNANGIQEAGEAGIANATVKLLDAAGNIIATTTTDENGLYSFSDLTPGEYKVQFVQPDGFNGVSAANVGSNDAVDSDGLISDVVNLSPGENDTTVDAGFYKTASLGDKAFNDANNNGIQDAAEAGVAGVTVQLINPVDGSVIGTTTTDADGGYSFSGLTPGDYQVKFTSPTGYIFSTANVGDDSKDSDANSTTGLTQTVTLTSGEYNGTLDAGLVQLASLGNFVFEDKNANGIQEASEVGIANATVKLLDAAGNVITTTTTDENGLYSFSNLSPGDYKVQFVQPDAFNGVSVANVGANDEIDSDGLISDVVNLSPGENDTTVDSGFYKTASLGDKVFNDANNNGIQDAAEAGVAGVKVQLINPVDGSVIGTTTTDALGAYTFSGLKPGDYQVKFTSPTGYIFSTANVGDDSKDSDANSTTGLTQTVTLTSGEYNGTLDAGLVQLASLGNFVFEDKNANGIQEASEAGIANATVKLLDVAGNVITTTTTDENGLYSFSNLQPGDYKVQFVQPDGFNGVSVANVGNNDAIDSDGLISDVVNLSPGENDTTVDAGFYKTASLGDKVFNDANNNGIQDATEAGVAAVTVNLIGGGADGIINGIGDTIVTTTTNASGNYNFAGLTPGQQYQVEFSNLPAGYQFTQANIGTNDAVDSDVNSSTGKTQIVTLASGENNTTLDAGIYQNAGDLSITKTNGLTNVTPGQQITYTIVATNNGLITATNALVSDIMPSNLTNVTWTSVASGGAIDNQTSGKGNINDYVTLTAGSSITYTVNGTVSSNPVSTGSTGSLTTFDLGTNANNSLDGTDGNTRTFTKDGITVTARAFSRVDGANGAWSNAYLGSYSGGGLGVTDSSEGDGRATHRVDNVGGRDNYVLFQFSESVVLDRAYLQYVINDSDISVWIGNSTTPVTALNDSILNSFGFNEVNETTLTTDRWADVNASNYVGNTIVITASAVDATPEDQFKIRYLDVLKPTPASLVNIATITGPTGFTDTNTSNNSATDTDTIVAAPTVKLGDRVWYDVDGDGVQDTGESGVSGVGVKLFNQAGAQIGTTTTDVNGLYQFSVNANSSYSIQFAQPTGFDGFTTANAGSDTGDSDVINSNGTTAQFSVGTTDNLTIDAGLIKNIGDLSITKSNGLTSVTPGQKITYTIVAKNNGLMTATNALVSDIMPTTLTDVTWTSVATGGAKDNQASGTGNINDYVTLAGGSSITYTVNGTVSSNPISTSGKTTFDFGANSSSALDGLDGNTRTFTKDGVTVTARAFSRVDGTNGAWSNAYLGSYSGGGLGVTDSSEGNGNSTHRVDNVGGRDNYVLFQFSESVVLDRAYLQWVINDSDISVWIGNSTTPVTALNDSILSSFGFNEVNETTLTTDRWADVNAGNYVGNTIVIAASAVDATPEDQFKIRYLDVLKPTPASLVNTATITGPTGFTDTNTSNNSATDTDTILAAPTLPSAPGVRTPGFWQNSEWQKFWDGIQGNEPSQKTESNFVDSDLLFAPYTNSAQPGKVLDPVTGQYETGLIVGDFNRNGKTDAGEDTLFYSRAQALQIVDGSQHTKGDKRYDLGRSLVASWLNFLAGNPIDTANTTDNDARYYIKEGINWLQALTPDENGDNKGDGALSNMTGSNVDSPLVDSWSLGISSASSLSSPYNNTNVLYGLDAGSVINTNLDNYNNGRGLADNVYHG